MYDTIILGCGPAGVGAALTLRQRNKSVLLIAGAPEDVPLYKAPHIRNYPGVSEISGQALLAVLEAQARSAGAELIRGRATAVLPMGDAFGVSVGQDFYESRTVIVCTGVTRGGAFPGERELLGAGVSTCVTCDGMLYRGRRVCVVGFTAETEAESALLRDMGCQVELFTEKGKKYAVLGTERVTGLAVNGEEHPCEGVFILRPATLPEALVNGLQTDGPHIVTDRAMATGIPGLYAAGDCAGLPYQVAKAAGEGNIAALSAAAYMEGHP